MKVDKYYGLCIHSERRKNLEKYEKLLGIEIDTSFSVNGYLHNKQYYIKKNLVVPDTFMDSGAIGCTLSFYNIYKDIVKNKYKYCIIFEDDIDWNFEFYKDFNLEAQLEKIDRLYIEWDVFYLGTEAKGKLSNQKHIEDNIYQLECGKISIPIKNKTYKSFNESIKSNKNLYNYWCYAGRYNHSAKIDNFDLYYILV